ncbi:MAG: hypothetical protein KDK36_02035, partial [Leptospiraceae bacterium]|nr:hypothetical protein [Leptospiraceae bacterium]
MKYLISILHKKHTAWVILLISFLLTYIAWEISHISIENKLKERFYFQSQDITKAIEKRMLEYEIVLRAGIGLFKSKKDVSRNDWKVFTNELKLDKYFPGIQGLGFSKFI